VLERSDVGYFEELTEQPAYEFAAGGVTVCVEDAWAPVASLLTEGDPGPGHVELYAPIDQLPNPLDPFTDGEIDDVRVGHARADRECVAGVVVR
jgi:hypothetical protein